MRPLHIEILTALKTSLHDLENVKMVASDPQVKRLQEHVRATINELENAISSNRIRSGRSSRGRRHGIHTCSLKTRVA